ncbi:MAG: hypothetical protein LBV03_05920 [Fusobacteriales bacterium]|jgi:hypothetical protein|nr:hypothetical protein [Fusobacteriales bacterium]
MKIIQGDGLRPLSVLNLLSHMIYETTSFHAVFLLKNTVTLLYEEMKIIKILIGIGLIIKDIFLIHGNFKNIYIKIIDIVVTLFIPVLNILIILALAAINSNGKIEMSWLNIFLVFLAVFSILKFVVQ